jgi:hypothetical protein
VSGLFWGYSGYFPGYLGLFFSVNGCLDSPDSLQILVVQILVRILQVPFQVFPRGEVERKTLARWRQINVKLTESAVAEGGSWFSDSFILFLLDAHTSGDWGV